MGRARNPSNVLRIKEHVRHRDGYRCTKCGRSNDQHREATGRQLQVHRLSPGSRYTVEGCVTLCLTCHGPEPKRPRGSPDFATGRARIPIRLNEADFGRLKAASDTLGIDMAQLIRSFIKKQLPHVEREAEEIRRSAEGE